MNEFLFKALYYSIGTYIKLNSEVETNLKTSPELVKLLKDKDRSVLLTSNHKSVWETAGIPLIVYEATEEQINTGARNNLFAGITKKIMGSTSTFSVERDSRFKGIKRMRKDLEENLLSNRRTLIFPEGTRSRTGEVGVHKPLSYKVALENDALAQTHIIPVDVTYNQVLDVHRMGLLDSKKTYKFKPLDLHTMFSNVGKLNMTFGNPINMSDFKDASELRDHAQKVHENLVKITASNIYATALALSNFTQQENKLSDKINEVIDDLFYDHQDKFRVNPSVQAIKHNSAVSKDSDKKVVEFYKNQINHYLN
jgi:1-acyl-sn-glycerol-3-phosphate acyltransferase